MERGDTWLNDGEGTQPRARTSFGSIDAYYGRVQAQGFHSLSYFNVFEYVPIGFLISCSRAFRQGGQNEVAAAVHWQLREHFFLF